MANDARTTAIQKLIDRLGAWTVVATPLLVVALSLMSGGGGGWIVVAGIGALVVGLGLQLGVMWWQGGVRREQRRKARTKVMLAPPPGSRHSIEILTFPKVGRDILARSAIGTAGEVIVWRRGFSESSAAQRARRWCDRHLDARYVVISSRRLDADQQ